MCEEAFDCFKKQAHLLTSHSKKVCVSLTGGIDSGITAKAFENEIGEIEYFTYYDPKETIKGVIPTRIPHTLSCTAWNTV